MIEDSDLTHAAARLARAAPREWEEFKIGFRKYADTKRDQLVTSDLNELQKSQGRAQACHMLVLLFGDAVKASDLMAERANKKLVRNS